MVTHSDFSVHCPNRCLQLSYTNKPKYLVVIISGDDEGISVGIREGIMEAHNQAVAAISKRLEDFYARREAFRVYHGSTNSTRAIQKDSKKIIDTSQLNHVLAVDKVKKTALVEPNVPMDQLVEAALKNGLVPLVVMEFPGITVGGGFSGSAGESSSGRHGPFDSTVNSIEIVIPNGEIRRASKTEDPDLFWGAASAFGTVGVVTLLEVQLQDATQYVELTHYPVRSFAEASKKLQEQVADTSIEFVDGIVFSPSQAIICAGRLVDTLPSGTKPRRYLGRSDPWFYLDVQKRAAGSSSPVVDYVPLVDYLFRWDRGGFWVARYAYRYFLTPFNRITRYALDTFMHARVMYQFVPLLFCYSLGRVRISMLPLCREELLKLLAIAIVTN